MGKRLFEILDEMNVSDTENNTNLVSIANSFVGGKKVKQGAEITMGVDEVTLIRILLGECTPILVVVKKDEYFKIKEQTKKQ